MDSKQENEQVIWAGSPSQFTNFGSFFIYIITIPLSVFFASNLACEYMSSLCFKKEAILVAFFFGSCMFFYKFIKTYCHTYEVTDQRVIERSGIISRATDELEIFRVHDLTYEEPFTLRIFGRSNIVLHSADLSNPKLVLVGMKNGQALKEKIRKAVYDRREVKLVREVDVN
jgi:uncharacterized membrane protein YdbT with pleckstrin-like domain